MVILNVMAMVQMYKEREIAMYYLVILMPMH